MFIHKCKLCGTKWTPDNDHYFFSCSYCDELYCNGCHSQKQCLTNLTTVDIDDIEACSSKDLLVYIVKLLVANNRATNNIMHSLNEIESRTP